MNLKFIKPHKSISSFNNVNLEDFTILTGYNGSGKSHLLESLKNGSSQIDSIPFNEVILFDYKTFFLENEQAFNNQQINLEKQNAWNKLINNGNPNIKNNLINYRNQLGEENYVELKKIANGRPFLSIPKIEFDGKEILLNVYNQYKTNFYNLFNIPNVRNSQESHGLKSLALSIDKTLDDLSEDEFFDFYSPVILKNDFLPSQIGKLFIDYWYKYQMFEIRKIRETKAYDESQIRNEFEKIHGPRPWILIENILQSFDSFKYTINNPENIIIEPDRNKTFTLSLTNKSNGISIPFDNLSSGEKILFSLVLSIYKSQGDKLFPSILLLDEIDASLHPSQIQNLLNVINNVFVKTNNVKVIIATHSPTTIALAEERNIFVVDSTGTDRIKKQNKKNALKILSEGFITLDEGLQIFDEVTNKELTIFTEGNNISYIERAIILLAPELFSKIEIVNNLKDRTGKNQLQNLFEFFTRMPHSKKVLFIFDCDVTTKLEESENTFCYIFEKNLANEKVSKGIENLFSEENFSDNFYPIKPKDDGGFQSSLDKNKFEKFILDRNRMEDFSNFEKMIDKLKEILSENTEEKNIA